MKSTTYTLAAAMSAKMVSTTNGAPAMDTTYNKVLDLFAQVGAMRSWNAPSITTMTADAFEENALLTMKTLFYARNVRGGLGERNTFRVAMQSLAKSNPELVKRVLHLIPEFGRWDDLYCFVGTPVENFAFSVINAQWSKDVYGMLQGCPISLMAKWLPSADASNYEVVRNAKLTAKRLGLSQKEYRQMLSRLRKHLNVVERNLCSRAYECIDYSAVPSNASLKYRKAFNRNDAERYGQFVADLKAGKTTINATTLYPYDLLEQVYERDYRGYTARYDEVVEQQWKRLPNYLAENGKTENILVMADTSGSMTCQNGRPLMTSIGLAIYFAEKNTGPFKNQFMTFSSRPELVRIQGDTLCEKVRSFRPIVENTNLEAAFRLVLDTAVKVNLPADEMPKSIVVITDMQFDRGVCCGSYSGTLYDQLANEFAYHGYTIPNVVFWNVNAPAKTFQATCGKKGVQMVSGSSPAVFKSVIDNIGKTPVEAMLNVLNNPAYDCVGKALSTCVGR